MIEFRIQATLPDEPDSWATHGATYSEHSRFGIEQATDMVATRNRTEYWGLRWRLQTRTVTPWETQ